MQENWEIHWKDYYKILQVQPIAEAEVVKAAYDRLARKYHPDINSSSEASQRMKDLNEAFETLGNPEKRTRYDSTYYSHHPATPNRPAESASGLNKPSPEIYPHIIRFSKAKRGKVQRGSFVVTNNGGPFKRIQLYSTRNWIHIVRQTHLNPPDKLPLRVEFEAQGDDWDASYINNFVVKLDNEEDQIRIELTTLSESAQQDLEDLEAQTENFRPEATSPHKSLNLSWLKNALILLIILAIVSISIIIWKELQPILNAWRSLTDIKLP